jgi:hypothetical protein
VTFEFPSADAFADFRSQIGGTRATLSTMPPDVATRVREAVVSAAKQYADAGGVVRLINEALCFRARR